MRRYYSRSADRYSNYREITARFPSTGSCGHEIKTGERIGYNPGAKKTQCPACWIRWCAENAEAQQYEDNLAMSGGW